MPELNNNRGNNRRRGRGNNRPQGGGQQLNRIDSRARGNAPQLLEKYRKMAQDAHLNGDRVQAEYYLQFADHYFRVIADTRLRQEEARQRHSGNGERWSEGEPEDDGMDFSIEGDFPAFDRPYVRREEREVRTADRQDRPERQDRQDRQERPERSERQDRPERQERADRTERQGETGNDRGSDRGADRASDRSGSRRRFEDRRPSAAVANAADTDQPVPLEGVRADEGEPVTDVSDNPFIRESRSPRGPRQQRTERRPRRSAVASEGLDPASLPPAIGVRSEPAAEAPAPAPAPAVTPAPAPAAEPASDASAEAAPAPKRRGRPRKNPLPESAEG
ncbi:DUF4167 domain-containing protein [Novosphingobium capsulatum]|uniref:DUF4167 domain-containing protein n=1 Tax=Novosphingobium capsulatum TaxID=13688 RepID=UPI003990A70A